MAIAVARKAVAYVPVSSNYVGTRQIHKAGQFLREKSEKLRKLNHFHHHHPPFLMKQKNVIDSINTGDGGWRGRSWDRRPGVGGWQWNAEPA